MEYQENILERRIWALSNISEVFLDYYKRSVTDPRSVPSGELRKSAEMLKSSLELTLKTLNENM